MLQKCKRWHARLQHSTDIVSFDIFQIKVKASFTWSYEQSALGYAFYGKKENRFNLKKAEK